MGEVAAHSQQSLTFRLADVFLSTVHIVLASLLIFISAL